MAVHRINKFDTIEDFTRLGKFEMVMKHGQHQSYEKFTGTLNESKVKGLISTIDNNVYGITKIID